MTILFYVLCLFNNKRKLYFNKTKKKKEKHEKCTYPLQVKHINEDIDEEKSPHDC